MENHAGLTWSNQDEYFYKISKIRFDKLQQRRMLLHHFFRINIGPHIVNACKGKEYETLLNELFVNRRAICKLLKQFDLGQDDANAT